MVDHIISGCLELAKTDYTERGTIRLLHISSERRVSITKIEVQKKWFEHLSETVTAKMKKLQSFVICRYVRIAGVVSEQH